MKERSRLNIIRQIWVINFIFVLFSLSASVSKISDKSDLSNVFKWDLFIIIPFIAISIFLVKNKKYKIKDIKQFLLENKVFLILIFVISLVRIMQFGNQPRWDTDAYLSAIINGCEKFNFTVASYLKSFRLCSHSTLGYSLFISIGEFICPRSMVGINLVNLVLVDISAWMIYKILQDKCKKSNKWMIALGTLVIFLEPMFTGTFYNLSMDFGIVIFSVFIIYFSIQHNYLLFTFFACILVQTKEVGVVVLAGFFVGYAIISIILDEGKLYQRVINLASQKTLWGTYVGGILMIFYQIWMNLSADMQTWGGSINSTNKTNNYISINFSYIILKLKTMIFLNFYWVVLILILVSFIILLTRKIPIKQILRNYKEMLSMMIGCLFLLVFNCLYITFNNPRYNMIIEFYIVYFGVLVSMKLISEKKESIVLVLLATIFAVQSYTTIDFVSMKMFDTLKTSDNNVIVNLGWKDMVSLIADNTLYNNQNAYIDKAFDGILRKEKYSENKDVIIGGVYNSSDKYEGVKATLFDGKVLQMKWNSRLKKRVYFQDKDNQILNILYEYNLNENKTNNQAILLILKQFSTEEDKIVENMRRYYTIGERKEYSVFGQGSIYYYIMEKKNE